VIVLTIVIIRIIIMIQEMEIKEKMTENTIPVQINLPEGLHRLAKAASALEKKDDGTNKKLEDIIIERFRLGLEKMPVVFPSLT